LSKQASDTPADHAVLPPGWISAAVGEVCSIAVGFAFKSEAFTGSGIRLLRGENIEPGSLRWKDTRYWAEDKLEGFRNLLVEQGDIILAMDRPVISSGLKLARATADDVPCLLVQRVARIRTFLPHVLTYLYYNLQSGSFVGHLIKGQTGTQLPHISHSAIPEYRFPIAPESEQRRIVAKIEELFSDLDAGVVALERVRANLKRYRASVLKAAVEGKLTEDWRAQQGSVAAEGQTGADSTLFLLTSKPSRRAREGSRDEAQLPTGDLPSIPSTWTWVPISTLASKEDGSICAGPFGTIFKARDFRPSGVPIIFLRHVAPGKYLTQKPGFMDRGKWIDLFQPYSVFGGELLVTKLGEPPGTCAIYPRDIGPAMVTPDVIKMSVNPDLASPLYLMHYLNSMVARRFSSGAAFGTTRLRLTIPLFRGMPVPVPPMEEQGQIVSEIERRLSIVDEIEAQIDANEKRAARLRQGILKRAFEGRLVSQDPSDEPAERILESIRQGSLLGSRRTSIDSRGKSSKRDEQAGRDSHNSLHDQGVLNLDLEP
jgi:type I restriction enzyme S subunit